MTYNELVKDSKRLSLDDDAPETGYIPKCDQCDSVTINGLYCHETGCPNARKRYDTDSELWVEVVTCPECGNVYDPEEESCCCESPEDPFLSFAARYLQNIPNGAK